EELWVVDQTTNEIRLVADISPGPTSSQPLQFVIQNGRLYFTADDGIHGRELWVLESSTESVELVADIFPGPDSSYPSSIESTDLGLAFSANDGFHGSEPWLLPNELRGDFDGNNQIDANDVDLVCAAVQASSFDFQFDLNGDMSVDLQDVDHLLVDIIGSSAGDLNLDGEFNNADLELLASIPYEQETNAASWASGDLNCDGKFNSSDFVRAFQQQPFTPRRASTTTGPARKNSDVAGALVGRLHEERGSRTKRIGADR
ncbi:MAG: hypothetical protein KDB27_23665, partial [Planctomycetales bacterium]|nr:hypothetical protein [Planctomycetales bacterium]